MSSTELKLKIRLLDAAIASAPTIERQFELFLERNAALEALMSCQEAA